MLYYHAVMLEHSCLFGLPQNSLTVNEEIQQVEKAMCYFKK